MLRLRLVALLCAGVCTPALDPWPAHGGPGRGGGAGHAHFGPSLPQFSAPRIAPQISAPRSAPHFTRTLPALGIPPSQWGRPSPTTGLRANHPTGPRTFQVPREQNFPRALSAYGTASIGHIRVWPGNASAFTRRQFSIAPFGGLHSHLQPRLQGTRFQPQFQPLFAARHHHHHHRFGAFPVIWSDSLFWPDAYSDLLDYTFYPYAYDDYGPYLYPDIYQGIFGEPTETAYAAAPGRTRWRAPPSQTRCGALLATPPEEIAQTLNLNDAQREALKAFNQAADEAHDTLSDSCADDLPKTPLARMQAMQARLSSILRGVEKMRPLFDRFYALLNETQRAQLDARASADAREPEQSCNERSFALPGLPVERIARTVQPDASQRAALRDLEDAFM